MVTHIFSINTTLKLSQHISSHVDVTWKQHDVMLFQTIPINFLC